MYQAVKFCSLCIFFSCLFFFSCSRIDTLLVGTKIKYSWVLIENLLSAIAMVHIPIYNEHFFDLIFFLKVSCSNRYVIKKTKSHPFIRTGMMARWSYQTKGVFCLFLHY